MPLHANTLKASAREAMRAAAPPAFLVTLVYLLLTQVLSEVVYAFTPPLAVEDLFYGSGNGTWMALFLSVLMIIFQTVMTFGYSCWALRVSRNEEVGLGALMEGFGMVGRVLLTEIHIFLGILGWGLVLVMGYSILLVPAILLFNRGFGILLAVFLTLACYIGFFVIGLRYDLAHFLLCDYPEDGSTRAVHRSLDMLHGHLWDLVKLYLSFWPWYLLSFSLTLIVMIISVSAVIGDFMGLFYVESFHAITALLETALSGTLATAFSMLIAIPLKLFFQPYQRIAVANFYRALSYERVEQPPFDSDF